MQPGETIDIANTSVRVTGYIAYGGGAIFYSTDPGAGFLTFSNGSFFGTFGFTVNQGSDINPAETLYITGNIRTSLGRTIPIDIQSTYTSYVSPSRSSTNVCQVSNYIPPVPPSTNDRKWKLTNDNLTTSIRWQALLSDRGTIVGGILTPGNFVGSTFYGGTYTCIVKDSLTYGSGGTVIDLPC
jgi:hypothetical protein